ncbi:General negative regulator of transcription subunit 4 [Cyberlindnera fabianii]|uniref:General negative regulator of transcription subunit 4 n=1 Tax=Cyberlindnera fabianii TaxID=36022 RepID=A0A1V2L2S7_CYBFA|nr:General negative regulator of transcription subunit 4 [Cyberlindnera fabianii]
MIYNNDYISDDDNAEDDLCPLCVEEMDAFDKNFKPCPCGYQICQFCYNNIRQNPELNGRCPACRRKYDDESVEYKQLSPDELKMEQSKQSRREKERRAREKEKKETEQMARKHLSGMRVIQKNLVYIIGLNPPSLPQDELYPLLKSEKYFGQFGRVTKLVVNRKPPMTSSYHAPSSNGAGVYVTFAKKDDAKKCIDAIDGSWMDGKILKATYGTTKYCSSYLRGQPCPNPGCMFLHEPGEEAETYSRHDLSTRQSLRMGGAGEASRTYAPFPMNSVYHSDDTGSTSSISSPAPSSNTQLAGSSSHGATLPPIAPWASKTAVQVPTTDDGEPPNAMAFPSLGETITQTTQQQQQPTPQPQHNNQKKQKHQQPRTDEFNPVAAAVSQVESVLSELKNAQPINFTLRADILTDDVLNAPQLFSFKRKEGPATYNRTLSLNIVKKFIQQTTRPPVGPPPQFAVPPQVPVSTQPVSQTQTPSQTQAQLNEIVGGTASELLNHLLKGNKISS